MRKTLLIARHAYFFHIRQGWFSLLYFGLPIIYISLLAMWLALVQYTYRGDQRPAGYVDQAGILSPPAVFCKSGRIILRPYPTITAAETALAQGEIQAYYTLGRHYLKTGEVTETAAHQVAPSLRANVKTYLRARLLSDTPPANRRRITTGDFILHRPLDAGEFSRQFGPGKLVVWGMIIALPLASTPASFFLMHALAEEHSNRTIEIILSSVNVEELLGGKVLGLTAVGLTPLFVWGCVICGQVSIIWETLSLTLGLELPLAALPWPTLILCLIMFIPIYLLNALTVTLSGAILRTSSQNLRLLFSLGGLLPSLVLLPAAMLATTSPNAPLAIFLSWLPLTSPVVLPIRALQLALPPEEIAGSIGLLYLTAFMALRYSARLYRAIWLISGQKRRLNALWLALQGK